MHQVGTTHLGAPGPPGAPWWVVVPMWPPSLISIAHIITHLQKKIAIALSPLFLSSNPRIPISLLEAPFPKLFQGIVAWYVTPGIVLGEIGILPEHRWVTGTLPGVNGP